MRRKFSFLPLFLFILVYLLLNRYVLYGIHTVYTSTWLNTIFWAFTLGVGLAFSYGIKRIRQKGMDIYFKIISHTFLVFFVAELVFALLLLFGDAWHLFSAAALAILGKGFNVSDQSPFWVEGAIVIFFIVVVVFIYGMTVGKYAYRVIKHTLYFDDLPKNFDGFTITQISDVHSGSFTNAKALQKGIDMINAQKSDLFVFTGDLVNNMASEIKPWISQFSQIKAKYGQFSILGNHDYGDYVKWPNELEKAKNLQQLKDYHKDLGFKLLLDEHVEITKNNEKIILAGVENWGIGFGERGDLQKALQHTATNDFKVLLSHDPSHWDAQVKNFPSKIQLTLSGHTHGMQFGIEAFGIKWSPVKYRYKHWAGLKQENNRYLNVNRGFGFLGFSGRIGIWPEITQIELKKT